MLSEAAKRDGAMLGQVVYERREGDFYATTPDNVDCLAHFIDMERRVVWEPACGEGHISKRLLTHGAHLYSTDLYDRGYGRAGFDFLRQTAMPKGAKDIITNPPYGDLAEAFVRKALELTRETRGIVAMFLRNEWDMSAEDRPDLFEGHPAYAMKICVTKRPRWIEGSKGSPRHNYAWYVWDWQHGGLPSIRYIHPKNARPNSGTIH